MYTYTTDGIIFERKNEKFVLTHLYLDVFLFCLFSSNLLVVHCIVCFLLFSLNLIFHCRSVYYLSPYLLFSLNSFFIESMISVLILFLLNYHLQPSFSA